MKTYKQAQSEILAAIKEAEEITGFAHPSNAREIYDNAKIFTKKNNSMVADGDNDVVLYLFGWERIVYAKKRRTLMYFVRILIASRYSIMSLDQAKKFVNGGIEATPEVISEVETSPVATPKRMIKLSTSRMANISLAIAKQLDFVASKHEYNIMCDGYNTANESAKEMECLDMAVRFCGCAAYYDNLSRVTSEADEIEVAEKQEVKTFTQLVNLVNNSVCVCLKDINIDFDIFTYSDYKYKEEGFICEVLEFQNEKLIVINTDEGDDYITRSEEYAKDIILEWIKGE